MNNRKKASEIFNETDSLFVDKIGFEKAFPEIDNFVIEVTELEDSIWGKELRTRRYEKMDSLGEYVDCSNLSCYSGGVSVGSILREMIRGGKTEECVRKRCSGYEGSPQGQRRYRNCSHSFVVKICLKYK
ncbi:MAG: hypothetical protein ACTFAK_16430 [Candidatus Electronema sp. VV]